MTYIVQLSKDPTYVHNENTIKSLHYMMLDMGRLWKALEDEVKRRKIHERVVNALADAAIGLRVKNPAYRNLAGVSNQTAKYDLKRLADEGLLVPKGEKKGRYYVAGEVVQKLRNETRSKRRITDPFEEQVRTNP